MCVGFSKIIILGEIASIIMNTLDMGQKIIEKHFTLNKNIYGPDHLASSTPKEFFNLVKGIRRAENMKGSYKKEIQKEEINVRKVSKKPNLFK